MDLQLADRVVLVTGGSSGIGLATLQLLHQEGALLATCARAGDRLSTVVAESGFDRDRILVVPCDVRDPVGVQGLVRAIEARFGRLDGLVNNAGRSLMRRLGDTGPDDWREELELKFGSVLNPTTAALPLLQRSPAGSIVNINAILSVQPEPALAATSAADPPLDPPVPRSGSQGLRVGPRSTDSVAKLMQNSGVAEAPRIASPASRARAVTSESRSATAPASARSRLPTVNGRPEAKGPSSFIRKGTPASGPVSS